MTILFWIIFGPILLWACIKAYNYIVQDFSPVKERRKQAKQQNEAIQEATDRWFEMWLKLFFKLLKIAAVVIPIILLIAFIMDSL